MVRQERTPSVGRLRGIEKCPTGIRGPDEITGGGLPRAQLEALQFKTASLGEEIHTLQREQESRLATEAGEEAEPARVRGADGDGDENKKGVKGHAGRRART